jgi:PleD family two-component response regulator
MLASACPRSTKSKYRLLYLGTDVELIAALRQVLTEPDYVLVACSDWGSVVMFLKSEIPYDAVLLDLEWRGTEGLKLAPLAGSLRHRKRMPIIAIATQLNNDVQTLARKAGVKEYVTKTPNMGTAAEAIRKIIEGRTASAD